MTDLQRHTRCEYCRQLSDGLECRKCGAPLSLESRYSVGSQPVHVTTQGLDGMVSAEKVLEYLGEPDPEGVIKSFAEYNYWYQHGLVNWRLRE